MKQRRRWGEEVRVAIDAADKDGMPFSRILARLRDGSLDGLAGRPQAMSESTFADILRRVREARIETTEYRIEPGQEIEAADTIIRETLAMAHRDLARAKHSESASESQTERRQRLALATAAAKTASDCRYWLKRGEAKSPRPAKTGREMGNEASRTAPKRSAVGALISARKQEGEPASPLPLPLGRHVSQAVPKGKQGAESQVGNDDPSHAHATAGTALASVPSSGTDSSSSDANTDA